MSSAINEANFKDARRGYNKKEVRAYLADLEAAFSEMEGHARESARRIGDLEHMVGEMKATEAKSMDNAMYAVFDAKDRILEKANRRAEKIENEAREKADELLADVKEMLDATRGVQTDGPDSVSPEAVLIAAREEAAQIREEAARYAATVSDGDVETITEELAKARADAIAERARAEKYEELSRSQAVELGDLNRDQGDGTPDEGLAEARAQGTNIIAQAQTEAESILQRASDEARTVRDLARQETDRAA
ncbi:MAG: DivIVA domain-containing protein, partial [Actinobacteria bacterium]|nr:DivIVA domain-containing protein [Actinomycetota bacterium]